MLVRVVLVLVFVGCKAKSEPPKAEAKSAAIATPDAAVKRTLAEELEVIRAEHKLPALAAAVWRDGKLVELDAVGLRKSDDPTSKVTANDDWHLGSNTKAMTATLIGIYVDRGALRWDDTMGKLLKGSKINPGKAKVTLDQLIRQKAGAPAEQRHEL